jgi:hypothetical protein
VHPPIGIEVALGKSERMLEMSLAFFASTNENFRKPKERVGVGANTP